MKAIIQILSGWEESVLVVLYQDAGGLLTLHFFSLSGPFLLSGLGSLT
jgi:hypothetical protein